jgi:HKD family nuclease
MKMSLKHTQNSKDASLEKLLASLKNTLERGTDFALIIGFISSEI